MLVFHVFFKNFNCVSFLISILILIFYRYLKNSLSWLVNESGTREETPFSYIFKGQFRQDITCKKCSHVSTTFHEFSDILLDIKDSSTIEKALKQFFEPKPVGDFEDMNTLFTCGKCLVKVQAQSQYFIEKAPPVLCLHLNRFTKLGANSGVFKDDKIVQSSNRLDVAPYLTNAIESNYLLKSMIQHVGNSPNSGHYTSIGKASSNRFYQFDDSSVQHINTPAVLSTKAYVVFYEIAPRQQNNDSDLENDYEIGRLKNIEEQKKLFSKNLKEKADEIIGKQKKGRKRAIKTLDDLFNSDPVTARLSKYDDESLKSPTKKRMTTRSRDSCDSSQETLDLDFSLETTEIRSDHLPNTVEFNDTHIEEQQFESFQPPTENLSGEMESEDQNSLDTSIINSLLERRKPSLNAFLATIVSLLNEKELNPCDIQKASNSLEIPEWDWECYQNCTPIKFDDSKMKVDYETFELYRSCGKVTHIPVSISSNNNSLFKAKSVLMCGDESLELELKVSTTLCMLRERQEIEHAAECQGLKLSAEFDYMKELLNAVTLDCYQSTVHFIALAWASKSAAWLLYPNLSMGLTNETVLLNSGLIGAGRWPNSGHFIMWSGQKNGDLFEPNRFVPLVEADGR